MQSDTGQLLQECAEMHQCAVSFFRNFLRVSFWRIQRCYSLFTRVYQRSLQRQMWSWRHKSLHEALQRAGGLQV